MSNHSWGYVTAVATNGIKRAVCILVSLYDAAVANSARHGLRSFDLSTGEHPTKWLLQSLSVGEGLLEALWIWIDGLLPGEIAEPVDLNVFAACWQVV